MEAQPRFLHADVPLALRNRCVEFAREAAAKEKVRASWSWPQELRCASARITQPWRRGPRVCVAAPTARKAPAPTLPVPRPPRARSPAHARTQVESAIAAAVKRRLEAHDGALWHVVVGRGFGASVAHEAGGLLSFQLGPLSFLAFRSFDDASLVRPQAERRPAAPAAAAPDAPTGGGDATAVAAAAHDDDHEGDGET